MDGDNKANILKISTVAKNIALDFFVIMLF
jgi:hypothetical protein